MSNDFIDTKECFTLLSGYEKTTYGKVRKGDIVKHNESSESCRLTGAGEHVGKEIKSLPENIFVYRKLIP